MKKLTMISLALVVAAFVLIGQAYARGGMYGNDPSDRSERMGRDYRYGEQSRWDQFDRLGRGYYDEETYGDRDYRRDRDRMRRDYERDRAERQRYYRDRPYDRYDRHDRLGRGYYDESRSNYDRGGYGRDYRRYNTWEDFDALGRGYYDEKERWYMDRDRRDRMGRGYYDEGRSGYDEGRYGRDQRRHNTWEDFDALGRGYYDEEERWYMD